MVTVPQKKRRVGTSWITESTICETICDAEAGPAGAKISATPRAIA